MLHIEQPDSGGTGNQENDQLNQQIGFDAEDQAESGGHDQQCQVGQINGQNFPAAGFLGVEALHNGE